MDCWDSEQPVSFRGTKPEVMTCQWVLIGDGFTGNAFVLEIGWIKDIMEFSDAIQITVSFYITSDTHCAVWIPVLLRTPPGSSL